MTGDPDRAALAWERGLREVPGPLLEAGGVGALDHDRVEVHSRGVDAADRFAGVDPLGEASSQGSHLQLSTADPGDGALGGSVGEAGFGLAELVLGLTLLDRGVDRGERLLVEEGDADLDEQHQAGGDQGDREDVQQARHRH